jgi:hypothetical protein
MISKSARSVVSQFQEPLIVNRLRETDSALAAWLLSFSPDERLLVSKQVIDYLKSNYKLKTIHEASPEELNEAASFVKSEMERDRFTEISKILKGAIRNLRRSTSSRRKR